MLDHKKIIIWGTGKEGRAAEAFIKKHYTPASITFIDENENADSTVITNASAIEKEIEKADVVIKSPGVSLYHPLIRKAKSVTSLLNLWFDKKPQGRIIAITGTKGKSTTSALLGHALNAIGHKTTVLGNIGVPVTEAPEGMEFLVLEMSSYQTADFKGIVDIAAVTSLYPEHLNWHGTIETYYADKLNLLTQARIKIIHPQVRTAWPDITSDCITCKNADAVPNEYLNRTHNRANVGVVLSIIEALGLDKNEALSAMKNFTGLPHRQQELGTKNGILFVDDSIATTPQAAIAAMEVYKGRAITLIAGGYDRGIDYTPLVNYICAEKINAVITMGDSGKKIAASLIKNDFITYTAKTMDAAIKIAQDKTPQGGVILLSPAAPSFGLFRDYIARGKAFAVGAGF